MQFTVKISNIAKTGKYIRVEELESGELSVTMLGDQSPYRIIETEVIGKDDLFDWILARRCS